jgi:hypothetical protein
MRPITAARCVSAAWGVVIMPARALWNENSVRVTSNILHIALIVLCVMTDLR